MGFFKKHWGLVLISLLSLFSILPLFQPGFFPMHDDTQVVRVHQMGQALKDGHFPVRWVRDLGYGYGYPIFNFYSPLPYYLGGFLNFLGLDALVSTKMMMGLGIILAGILMYFLAREFWGELGGTVAGLFYTFTPYHALDIYVRGAVGEFWAYAFLPLMALGFYKLSSRLKTSSFAKASEDKQISKLQLKTQNFKWIIMEAIGFSGIILSHNLTAIMVVLFLLIGLLGYWVIGLFKKKQYLFIIYHLSFTIFLALGLTSFYWLPAISEMKYTNVLSQLGGGADFKDHFVCLEQLWNSPWGFGGSIPGCLDGMSFKIGKLHLLTLIMGLFLVFRFWKKDKLRFIIFLLSTFYFLLSTFMTLEISKPVWEAIWPLTFVQYPWRFLLLTSFFASFLAGAVLWFFKNNLIKLIASGALVAALLFFNLKLFQPQTILPRTADFYTNPENIKWTTSKISDEYLPGDFLKPENRENIVKNRIFEGKIIIDKTQELLFSVDNEKEKEILVKIAPFPGWKAFIDGNSVNYISKNNGIEIFVPKGKHEVKLLFFSTAVEQWANLISLISLLALLGGILLRYAKS